MWISLFLSILLQASVAQSPAAAQATPATLRPFMNAVLQANKGETAVSNLQATADRVDAAGNHEPLKIYAQGSQSMRIERGTGEAQTVAVFNNGSAFTGTVDKPANLPGHVSQTRVTLFPFLDLLAEANNPDVDITLKDGLLIGKVTAWHVQLTLKDPHPESRFLKRGLDEVTDYYIDPQTLLVLRSDRNLMTIENMNLSVPQIQEYSDFRLINGVAVPFRIVTTEGTPRTGQARWTTLLQSVQINGGLPTNIFDKGGQR